MNSLPKAVQPDLQQQVEATQMELSDRLKSIIKELRITEEVLNNTYYNTVGNLLESVELIEPECHLQSIDAIERMTYSVQAIANRLFEKLR